MYTQIRLNAAKAQSSRTHFFYSIFIPCDGSFASDDQAIESIQLRTSRAPTGLASARTAAAAGAGVGADSLVRSDCDRASTTLTIDVLHDQICH